MKIYPTRQDLNIPAQGNNVWRSHVASLLSLKVHVARSGIHCAKRLASESAGRCLSRTSLEVRIKYVSTFL